MNLNSREEELLTEEKRLLTNYIYNYYINIWNGTFENICNAVINYLQMLKTKYDINDNYQGLIFKQIQFHGQSGGNWFKQKKSAINAALKNGTLSYNSDVYIQQIHNLQYHFKSIILKHIDRLYKSVYKRNKNTYNIEQFITSEYIEKGQYNLTADSIDSKWYVLYYYIQYLIYNIKSNEDLSYIRYNTIWYITRANKPSQPTQQEQQIEIYDSFEKYIHDQTGVISIYNYMNTLEHTYADTQLIPIHHVSIVETDLPVFIAYFQELSTFYYKNTIDLLNNYNIFYNEIVDKNDNTNRVKNLIKEHSELNTHYVNEIYKDHMNQWIQISPEIKTIYKLQLFKRKVFSIYFNKFLEHYLHILQIVKDDIGSFSNMLGLESPYFNKTLTLEHFKKPVYKFKNPFTKNDNEEKNEESDESDQENPFDK